MKFSTTSKNRLYTCDEQLVELFNEVIKHWDCTIVEGYRTEDRQNEMYRTGKSQLQWPNSKHNGNHSGPHDREGDQRPTVGPLDERTVAEGGSTRRCRDDGEPACLGVCPSKAIMTMGQHMAAASPSEIARGRERGNPRELFHLFHFVQL